jgi:hypothetical protein
MENVISKDSPDDMLVMFNGAPVQLIVPISARAAEMYARHREFTLDPVEAQRYLQSIIALAREDAAIDAELTARLAKVKADDSYIKALLTSCMVIQMSRHSTNGPILKLLQKKFGEVFLAASRYTIADDDRVQAIQPEREE